MRSENKIRWALLPIALVAAIIAAIWHWRTPAPPRANGPTASSSAMTSFAPRVRGTYGGFRGVGLVEGVVDRTGSDQLGSLSGMVISSADQRPVSGAEITFVGPGGARVTHSSATGAFDFQPEQAGSYEIVQVARAGFFSSSSELGAGGLRFVARPGLGLSGVVLRLDPEASYRGLVVDSKGAPVARAKVHIVGGDELELGGEGFSADHVSDEGGEFAFRAPDGAILEARHPVLGVGRARLDAAAQISHRISITLREQPTDATLAIRGQVVDEDGNPRADVAVIAKLDADNPALGVGPPPARASSGEQGQFVLEDLAPGAYSLVASDGTSAPAAQRGVVAGGPEVRLVLARGATLTGKVTDGTGGGVVPAFSVILSERRGPISVETVRTVTVFDADGKYFVDRIRPGRYLFSVVAKGYAPLAEREIEISGDSTADAALLRGATLSGLVRDAKTHAPLEGAKVSLEGRGASAEGLQQFFAVAVADATGRFVLTGLPAGQRSVFAAAAKHHARVIGIVVAGVEPVPPLVIDLTPVDPGETPRVELVGIGAVLAAKGDALLIGKVVDGGGAAEAGLGPGDAIVAVDGESVVTLGFEAAINRIRGPEGSSVSLLVRRGDGGPPAPLSVVRRRIKA